MLKLLALLTMVIDHVGFVFFPEQEWMRWIGRLTMPIFAYAIARGVYYTRSKKRYLIQLAVLAVISQVPYMLLFGVDQLNMIFPWALAVVALMLPTWGIPLIVSLAFIIPMDYSSLVILLPVLISHFWFKTKRPWILLPSLIAVMSAISLLMGTFQWWSLLAIPVIWLLERWDSKVRVNKWFFYWFYPGHLFVLLIIALLIAN